MLGIYIHDNTFTKNVGCYHTSGNVVVNCEPNDPWLTNSFAYHLNPSTVAGELKQPTFGASDYSEFSYFSVLLKLSYFY